MKIIRAGAYEAFYDMPLQIDWLLTKRCNYRCSYCFYYGQGIPTPPQLPFSTLEQLKNAVDNIASLNRPHYDIMFTGGECTLHPHMVDLIYMLRDTLQDRLRELLIITNGSRNEKLYKKVAEAAKSVNISMQVSVHTDHVDMEHFLDLIELLANDVNLYIPLMFNPAKREEVHLIFDILCEYRKRFPFYLSVAPVFINDGFDPRYTEEDLRWIKKSNTYFDALQHAVKVKVTKESPTTMRIFRDIEDNGERKIVETMAAEYANFANFKDMYCTASTSFAQITDAGIYKGLFCSPFFTCNIYEKGSLKAVRDKLFYALKCRHNICGCESAHYAPKFSSPEEANRFMEVFNAKQQALFDAKR